MRQRSRIFLIYEAKPVVYTYKVYAKSKAEALTKFNSHCNYEEVGLAPGVGETKITISEIGYASETCAECGERYEPDNIEDYRCQVCGQRRRP